MGEDRPALDDADRERIEAMLRYARSAVTWASEAGPRWASDEKTVAAVALAVGQVGENAARVSAAVRDRSPDIAWVQIRGMRNILYHAYDSVSVDVLEQTVAKDVPRLVRQLEALLRGGSALIQERRARYRSRRGVRGRVSGRGRGRGPARW